MAQARAKLGLCALIVSASALTTWALHDPPPAEQVDATEDAEVTPTMGATRCDSRPAAVDGRLLTRLLERLESRRSQPARCAVLSQLAARASLGEAAIQTLERYAHEDYPLRVRACALRALGYADHPAAVASLLQLSRGVDAQLRDLLLQALASREEPAARAGLVALARDASSPLCVHAAVALAELGAPEAVSVIAALLEEPGRHAGRLITALGESGDPQALGVLQRLLEHGGGLYGEELCAALGELGTPESTRLLLSLPEHRSMDEGWIFGALARSADPGAREALIAAADSGKRDALEVLSGLEDPEVTTWMLHALDSSDRARLQAATSYFSAHADERAVASLSRLTDGDHPDQASAALRALANIGGGAASAALEELAARPGPLQSQALVSLAEQPDATERARALALSLLEQGDAAPSSALDILAKDTSPDAHAALLRAARGESEQATWLLARRDDPETVNVLSEIARDERAANRISALSALAQSGSPQAADVMREALRADDASVREEAVRRFAGLETPDAEQALLHASRDAVTEVASAAVMQLGELGTPPALDRLATLARDVEGPVAQEALQSLADASPERASTVVTGLMSAPGTGGLRIALSAVSSLPEGASQQVLERALGSGDARFVQEALTRITDAELLPSAFGAALQPRRARRSASERRAPASAYLADGPERR